MEGRCFDRGDERDLIDEFISTASMHEEIGRDGFDSTQKSLPQDPIIQVDHGLYSRQLYVIGEKEMNSVMKSSILIIGAGPLGSEIAKNLVLAGVGSLEINDCEVFTERDLIVHFIANRSVLGESRANVVARYLNSMNKSVSVHGSTCGLSFFMNNLSYLKKFTCVVVTTGRLADMIVLDDYCRSQNIHFICTGDKGVVGWLFVDLGSHFQTSDPTGSEPQAFQLSNISKSNPGIVTVADGERHNLEDGNHVQFTDLKGISGLEGSIHQVTVISSKEFSIGDTSQLDGVFLHGSCKQIVTPASFHFSALRSCLKKPKLIEYDPVKTEKQHGIMALHIAMEILSLHQPSSRLQESTSDQQEDIYATVQKIVSLIGGHISKESVEKLGRAWFGCFPPISAILGGIVAQEVLKSVTNKFTPIVQQLYLDFEEVLPQQPDPSIEFIAEPCLPIVSCIGIDLFEKICRASTFVVGAGAIGCELLKNLATLHASTAPESCTTVTDNDSIEISNLSRQFLFRKADVSEPKATIAAKRILEMNPEFKIEAHRQRVGEETESTFTSSFFERQAVVLNALDNVESRVYMDRRCVACRVPLVDSGTLGLQGHVQVIVPHVSEPYGSQSDPMERAIPVCTLKYFPQTIEHSVQFARDKFEAMFLVKPWELKNLLAIAATQEPGGDYLKRLHLQTQIMLAKYCYRLPKTFSDCLRYGLSVFRKYFQHKIQRILAKHPRDSLADDGNLFWSPPKRMPHPIEFDQDNPLHIDFIWSFATIQARIFCVEAPREEDISLVKSSLALDARDDGFEDFKQALVSASVEQINDVFCREFYKLQISPDLIAPAPFEKDDDRNQHVRFVYALANLRAENYDIPNESFLKVRLCNQPLFDERV
eukprot:TRINITY_DN3903_c0_g1_i4.p1 TRINITY_DN3903_c0_g1~~TRINITY_DN3903_c0_g1_i4.p1  ORF type:complete len:880 (-),score=147.08 TRINITY_DN3903_c0_g1_i4:67-2706(-)